MKSIEMEKKIIKNFFRMMLHVFINAINELFIYSLE